MRISDRSSDVCSSDSADIRIKEREDFAAAIFLIFGRPSMFNRDVPTLAYVWTSSQLPEDAVVDSPYHPGTVRSIVLRSGGEPLGRGVEERRKIGQASCRERVCQYV